MEEYDWIWSPTSITFQPNYYVHEPVFGKQVHQFGSPHWVFELKLPPKAERDRREIAAFFAKTQGKSVVNVYDPRIPVPAIYYSDRNSNLIEHIIPSLTVKAVNRLTSTITVSGREGDVITVDDPIGFTHAGIRHYYKALDTLTLDGTDQELSVYLRPRSSLTGLDIELTGTDRIKPTCRFQIAINNKGGMTNADGMSDFMLKGVEFIT
jgi:hypothetical protein